MAARLVLFIALILSIQGCTSPSLGTNVTVQIGEETFVLELAIDNKTREQGLMYRTEIPPEGGMIFIFPDMQERSFWMKNCLIDIDIIFLDSRGTVTAVHTMYAELPQRDEETLDQYQGRLQHYWSHGPARFAIELSSGSFKRLHIKVNDHIPLDLPTLKRMAR